MANVRLCVLYHNLKTGNRSSVPRNAESSDPVTQQLHLQVHAPEEWKRNSSPPKPAHGEHRYS